MIEAPLRLLPEATFATLCQHDVHRGHLFDAKRATWFCYTEIEKKHAFSGQLPYLDTHTHTNTRILASGVPPIHTLAKFQPPDAYKFSNHQLRNGTSVRTRRRRCRQFIQCMGESLHQKRTVATRKLTRQCAIPVLLILNRYPLNLTPYWRSVTNKNSECWGLPCSRSKHAIGSRQTCIANMLRCHRTTQPKKRIKGRVQPHPFKCLKHC